MDMVVSYTGKKANATLIGAGLVAAGAIGAALAHEPTRKRIIASLGKLKRGEGKGKAKAKRAAK